MAINTVNQSDTFDTWRTTLNQSIGRWNVLGESSDITITGGNIDGTVIGDNTPADGTFSNLTVSSTIDVSFSTLILADNQISGNKVSGGTIECDAVTLSFDPSNVNHATRKSYVDNEIASVEDSIIAFSIVFGG